MRAVSSILIVLVSISIDIPVSGDPNPNPIPIPNPNPETQGITRPEQELLTKYLLHRLLAKSGDLAFSGDSVEAAADRSDQDSSSSIIYPQLSSQSVEKPLRILLDRAKDNIDVIDFRKPRRDQADQFYDNHPRHTRMPEEHLRDDRRERASASSSESIPTFLPFPGTEPNRPTRTASHCVDCVNDVQHTASRFSMPLTQLGSKKYYLGIFFKANWYKAEQYCRFHGMHLASINREDEQKDLEEHIESFGMGHEHFWTSGTDQAEEGKFFWMSTGKPVTYENWNAGEPNNFRYENGEEEHCLELWNRDGKGLRWNDTPCSFETFFVCEV